MQRSSAVRIRARRLPPRDTGPPVRVLAIKWMCKPRARCFRTLALLGLPNFSQQRVGVARVECGAQSLSGKAIVPIWPSAGRCSLASSPNLERPAASAARSLHPPVTSRRAIPLATLRSPGFDRPCLALLVWICPGKARCGRPADTRGGRGAAPARRGSAWFVRARRAAAARVTGRWQRRVLAGRVRRSPRVVARFP
jgi:hypothetical protein